MTVKSMTVKRARDRIAAMAPGARICYHIGFLLADRARREVDALADFMLLAGIPDDFIFSGEDEPSGGLNLGYLTQEKIADSSYLYYFTKAA